MEKGKSLERILELRSLIIKHDILYSKNQPIISDSEYDQMYMELVSLEDANPELVTSDSPTQKIYTTIVPGLEKVRHLEPMLSQEKIKTTDDIHRFAKGKTGDLLVQEKLDGLTIVLTYNAGILTDAVTRGDSEVGERVLAQIMTVKNVPKTIPYKGNLVVRAEAIIPFEEFNRIIESEDYSNPRNLVSGTIRQLDVSIVKSRNIECIVFELIQSDLSFELDTERLAFLKEQSFKVVNFEVFSEDSLDELARYCLSYNQGARKLLPYMVDGLVLKVNSLELRSVLGTTSKHPKWSCAFKFESTEAITTLNRVSWQVGKTGQITPVAEFDQVSIDGVKISRATLHNVDYITTKDIRVGDKIVVARANDVIPQVTQSLKTERETSLNAVNLSPVIIPEKCPVCGSKIERQTLSDGKLSSAIFCTGTDCLPQIIGRIKYYTSRNGMNIESLGEKTIELLVEHGLVATISDLYLINTMPSAFNRIEGLGGKTFDKVISSLEDSKNRPFSQVLRALSIPMLGTSMAKTIANHYGSMTNMLVAAQDESSFVASIRGIPGAGDVVAKNLLKFLKEQKESLISDLLTLGVAMVEPKKDVISQSEISGKTFVITGKLETYKDRNELKSVIEEMNAKVSNSVSSKTDFLINNDKESTSGKNKDAKKNGIKIISEYEFNELIHSN